MKTICTRGLGLFTLMLTMLFTAGLFAQGTPGKTGVSATAAEYSKVVPKDKRGEVTRETDCIDLYVKKGCVRYSVSFPVDAKKTPDVIQVCAQGNNVTDIKKVDICKPGATKITVKYEKSSDDALIEFVPRRPPAKINVESKTPEKQQ